MSSLKNNLSPAKKKFVIYIVTLLILTVLIVLLLDRNKRSEVKKQAQIPVPAVKLAILNGCGVDGAAGDVKDYFINLDLENVDIIAWRNVEGSKFIYGKTIIVSKKENEDKLNYMIKLTGINRKIYAFDVNAIEDIQIILGDDYRDYFAK